jgi:hypothetical protein
MGTAINVKKEAEEEEEEERKRAPHQSLPRTGYDLCTAL